MVYLGMLMATDEGGIFSPNDAISEANMQKRPSRTIDWNPTIKHTFSLTIPPTVYPPREDTNLIAKRLIQLGPGRGRKFLEIGCGSGALCLIAASLGWNVHACDINPFAVAATRGNLEVNMQSGTVKEGGVGPEGFPFEGKFDLIIWNLPYIPAEEVSEVLGPMEEAALVDTDVIGLPHRFTSMISKCDLLATNGKILLLSRSGAISSSGDFALRKWDSITFEDGEELVLYCLWKPYEMAEKIFVEQTGSTNDDLLTKSGIGAHIYTPLQTSGKGRRNRKWESIERCYAGSWIVAEGSRIDPGLIQLAGGLAVLNTVSNSKLKLKWPNDILIEDRKLCGILVEGRTSQNSTTAVIGIGINLETENHTIDGNKISTLSEIGEFDLHELDRRLNCELASLLEERQDIPPIDFESIRSDVLNHIRLFGKPRYKGVVYDKFDLNDKGELVFDSIIIDDGEEVDWI